MIAGLSHIPDEVTFRDIPLRQIRKDVRIKYDLEISGRAKEGIKEHTYQFLVQSIKDLPARERMRKNRDRIAKAHGEVYCAPAPTKSNSIRPPSRGGRGRSSSRSSNRPRRCRAVCYDSQKGKCTRQDKCRYLHKARSPSLKVDKPDKPNKLGKKINALCAFWKKGKCTRGDKCRFLHREPSKNPLDKAAPAPSKKPEKPTTQAACYLLAAAATEAALSSGQGDYIQ